MENQRVPCGSGIVGSDQKVAVPLEGSVWCAIYVFAQGGRLVGPGQDRSGRGVGLLGGIMAQDKLLWCCVPASGSHGFDLPEAGADLATTQRDGDVERSRLVAWRRNASRRLQRVSKWVVLQLQDGNSPAMGRHPS